MARITWDDDIHEYFTQMDVGCMRAARSLDLSDYQQVKARAADILERLKIRVTDPDDIQGMPKGGRAWPPEKIEAFEKWISDCCPKTQTDPGPPCP